VLRRQLVARDHIDVRLVLGQDPPEADVGMEAAIDGDRLNLDPEPW
jgi:hypothetical protein